jgi:hypothetical protein
MPPSPRIETYSLALNGLLAPPAGDHKSRVRRGLMMPGMDAAKHNRAFFWG